MMANLSNKHIFIYHNFKHYFTIFYTKKKIKVKKKKMPVTYNTVILFNWQKKKTKKNGHF